MSTFIIIVVLVIAITAIVSETNKHSADNKRAVLKQRMINDLSAKAPNGSTVTAIKRKVKDDNGKTIGKVNVFRIKASDSDDTGNLTFQSVDDNGAEFDAFVPYRQTEEYFEQYHKDDKARRQFDSWVDVINLDRINENGDIEPNPYALPELKAIIDVLPKQAIDTLEFPVFWSTLYSAYSSWISAIDKNENAIYWKDSTGKRFYKMDISTGLVKWNVSRAPKHEKWEDTTMQSIIDELTNVQS